MLKLAVFDIDGTLAPVGKSMRGEDVEKIKTLESCGVRIGLCSGKPIYYECGFARMLGIEEPIMIGDVGGAVQIGIEQPPERTYVIPVPDETKEKLRTIERELRDLYGGELWFEPAKTCVTPFPLSPRGFDLVNGYIDSHPELMKGLHVYRYFDSFDFVPVEINKKTGLAFACGLLDIAPEETAAVGDGQNDYPMFEFAKYSFGINLKEPERAACSVGTLAEALDMLIGIAKRENS